MSDVPAYIVGRRTDVLAHNAMAAAIWGDFGTRVGGPNKARFVFLDPRARDLYEDWPDKAHDVVAYLRLDRGRHTDDASLDALIAELDAADDTSARAWDSHDVRDKTHGTWRLHHDHVGPLVLSWETLRAPGEPDQALIACYPAPGSPSATALRLLAPLAAELGDQHSAHRR